VAERVNVPVAREAPGTTLSGDRCSLASSMTFEGGSDGRRSRDLTIFSRALYQLSYRASEGRHPENDSRPMVKEPFLAEGL
jgi:hypothetical protein